MSYINSPLSLAVPLVRTPYSIYRGDIPPSHDLDLLLEALDLSDFGVLPT